MFLLVHGGGNDVLGIVAEVSSTGRAELQPFLSFFGLFCIYFSIFIPERPNLYGFKLSLGRNKFAMIASHNSASVVARIGR